MPLSSELPASFKSAAYAANSAIQPLMCLPWRLEAAGPPPVLPSRLPGKEASCLRFAFEKQELPLHNPRSPETLKNLLCSIAQFSEPSGIVTASRVLVPER